MDGAALADELQRIFARTREDGTYTYSSRDARDGIVSLILVGGLDVGALPASLSTLLERFLAEQELGEASTPADVSRAVTDYFAKNPLNTELAQELSRFGRSVVIGGGGVDDAQAAKAAKLLGAQSAKSAPRAEDQGKGLNAMLALRAGGDGSKTPSTKKKK